MLSKDDLEKIGELIDTKLEAKLEEKLEAKLNPLRKDMRDNFERIDRKLDQSIEDSAAFFIHAGNFFDEMREGLVTRIGRIEKHVGLDKPKN